MKRDDCQIRVVILAPANSDDAERWASAVSSVNVACRVISLSAASEPGALQATDIVLIDWRNDKVKLPNWPKSLPSIALVTLGQAALNQASGAVFDDFATEAELGSELFVLRLKRLQSRYRNPVSLSRINSPELQLAQAIVNNSSDWIFVKDLYHRFLFVSETFAETTGLPIDKIIGRDDLEIGTNEIDVYGSPELGWRGFWAQDDDAIAGGVPTVELNPDWRAIVGQTQHRQCLRVPLKNRRGQVYALLVISSNVTNPADNRLDINARSSMLDKVLGEMRKAQESRIVAEQAEMAKNKLLASASHDLRQPLHAMGLFLDLLERRVSGEEERELISNVKRSSDALSILFNSLLDISRLDANVVEVNQTHFAIEKLLSNLRSEFEAVGLQKSLSIGIPPCDDIIWTDAVLLERILRNLVQNAVTYTKSGSVTVTCEPRREELEIVVTDTGPGIPATEQEAIFSEYYQMPSKEQIPAKGLGLGLAIVNRLVELMDLDIDLQSDVGHGARFSVSVPLGDRSLVLEAPATATHEPELQGQTILIIDDESDIRDGMARMLLRYNCSTITAESADQAIDRLLKHNSGPDVIVADYRLMAGETGDQAISRIRAQYCADIPAVIVTGDTSADRIKEATQHGFQILHKPVQPRQLVAVISGLLVGQTQHASMLGDDIPAN